MGKKLVSIIIPTYNREKEVLNCLKSLSLIDYPNVEVIVVDNASDDNTVREIKNRFPKAKIIRQAKNNGAVVARNIGAKEALGDYILFLDSDNYVKKDFLSELVKLMETDKNIGFAGPKMYFYHDKKRIWYAGVKINLATSITKYIGSNEIDDGQYDKIKEVEHIPNCWLVRKSIIDKIGLMDETFVMTYGEADWPMRAKKAGYKVMFCPSSIVYHNIELPGSAKGLRGEIGFDTPYRIYYLARNRTIFMRRYAKQVNFIVYIVIFLPIISLWYIYNFARYKRMDLLVPFLRGAFDGIFYGLFIKKVRGK
ncbi:MAG: glycosyltransferase family 2 protein [archaeon]